MLIPAARLHKSLPRAQRVGKCSQSRDVPSANLQGCQEGQEEFGGNLGNVGCQVGSEGLVCRPRPCLWALPQRVCGVGAPGAHPALICFFPACFMTEAGVL